MTDLTPAERCALHELEQVFRREPLSLAECGHLLGLGKDRVRQIEASALRKLRRAAAREGLSWAEVAPELVHYTHKIDTR